MPSKDNSEQEPVLSVVARKVGRAAGTLTHMAETLVGKKHSQGTRTPAAETATAAENGPAEVSLEKPKSNTTSFRPTPRKTRPKKVRQKRKVTTAKEKASSKPRKAVRRAR
jgi:hypothetical protein